MTMWGYFASSLAWSGFCLLAGAALGQIGLDLHHLVRHSGRHDRHDDT